MNAWSGWVHDLGSAFHASERWDPERQKCSERWSLKRRLTLTKKSWIHEYPDDWLVRDEEIRRDLMIVTYEVLGMADLQSLSHSKTKRMIRLIVNPQRMKLRNCGFYSRKFAASCSTRMYPCTTFPLFVILKEIVETLLPLSKAIVNRPWIPHDRSLYSPTRHDRILYFWAWIDRGFSLFLIFLKSIQMSLNSLSNQ